MAAYGTEPARYLPPHTSQLATKLSADGVDDCLVCSTLALVNGASLGEATRTPAGHEPSTRRTRPDRRPHAQQARRPGHRYPRAAAWSPARLGRRSDGRTHVARLPDAPHRRHRLQGARGAAPGPAPRRPRRQPQPHRGTLTPEAGRRRRPRHRAPAGPTAEGRARDPRRRPLPSGRQAPPRRVDAAKQVRQFAFRDSDSTLTAVWVERYGAWTAENLARRRLNKRIDRIEEEATTAAKQAARTEQRLRARIARARGRRPASTALRSSPRRSTPSGSPSATSSRHGGHGVNLIARPPRLAPGRAAGTRRGGLAAGPRGAGPDRRALPRRGHDARRLRARLER